MTSTATSRQSLEEEKDITKKNLGPIFNTKCLHCCPLTSHRVIENKSHKHTVRAHWMVQNRKMKSTSIEGANDQAIEDAASRIHEASRPQPMGVGCNQSGGFESHDNINICASPYKENLDDDSDGSSAFDGDNSTRSNTSNTSACDYNFIEDEDIENSIIYLEEKNILQYM